MMRGKTAPKWDIIITILDETGMSFEECFGGAKYVQ
jgi:hypothetical protein